MSNFFSSVLAWIEKLQISEIILVFKKPLFSKNIFKIYRNVGRIFSDIWNFSTHKKYTRKKFDVLEY